MERSGNGELQAITFQLGKETYGIDVHQIKEIMKIRDYVRVPNAPHFIEGVINLRGQITPIVDLRKIFGMEHRSVDENSRIIMVELSSDVVGLIVDSVVGVVTVPSREIVRVPSLTKNASNEFVSGIIRTDAHLIIVIEVKRLLEGNGNLSQANVAAVIGRAKMALEAGTCPSPS